MKVPDFWYRRELLGDSRRQKFEQLLDSKGFSWENSQELGFAGRGDVRQLATQADRESPDASLMRQVIASLVYDQAAPLGLPDPESMIANVFPVRMTGTLDRPASQLPHRDSSADGRRPIATAIYYVTARKVAGGELLVLPPEAEAEGAEAEAEDGAAGNPDWEAMRGTARIIVAPCEDVLVVIDGEAVHAVAPLTGGTRTSIVCNFFQS